MPTSDGCEIPTWMSGHRWVSLGQASLEKVSSEGWEWEGRGEEEGTEAEGGGEVNLSGSHVNLPIKYALRI